MVEYGLRQRSSMVEQGFHKTEVTGSNPVAGTKQKSHKFDLLFLFTIIHPND